MKEVDISDALPVGTVVTGQDYVYTIKGVLGRGGFGITYLVEGRLSPKYGSNQQSFMGAMKEHFFREHCYRDKATGAVLCSPAASKQVTDSLNDFVTEAKRLNVICPGNPNIIDVGEVFRANNTAYYFMEYIDGMSLRRYLEKLKRPLNDTEMVAIMNPVIKAIAYLHSCYITHLDIKPDNIMVRPGADGKPSPVLIDFGLSRRYNSEGSPVSHINVLGCSDGYSPLEQYSGITRFTPQADVYALGATMLFCLVGKDPRKAMNMSEEVINESIPATSHPDVRKVITAAMRPMYFERPPTASYIFSLANLDRQRCIELNQHMFGDSPMAPTPVPTPVSAAAPSSYPISGPVPKPRQRTSFLRTFMWIVVSMVLTAAIVVGVMYMIPRYNKAKPNYSIQTPKELPTKDPQNPNDPNAAPDYSNGTDVDPMPEE